MKDALAAKRRRMPMTEVTKDYRFTGPDGDIGLADLFDGRAQLVLGWSHVPWYTLQGRGTGADFAADHGVGEMFGVNVFLRDGDRIFRTYFVNGRGSEPFTPTWTILDLTPFGRQEEWEDAPEGRPQSPPYGWWGRPDEYG